MVMGSAFDILSAIWPPRTSFVNYPLGHQAGKAFDPEDQHCVCKAAIESFKLHTKPGQVNVLDCNWGSTEDICSIIGGKEVVLRRDTTVKYQTQADFDAAVARLGSEEAKGIVSPEAIRQQKALEKYLGK